MATLNPGEEFVISRQLNDPSDVSTYYVQAVIRNAKTDAIIATVNLDNKGSQRFTKTWQVVYDQTGLGLYITITTIVYTDSGYTTKSTVYGIEQYEHLIQDRLNPFLRNGVSGADIDYKKIRKIIVEELQKIPSVEVKEPDLIPISEGLQALLTEIRAIKIPEPLKPEKVDLQPVIKQLKALQNQIEVFPTTDLSPVLDSLNSLQETIDNLPQPKEDISPALSQVSQQLEKIAEQIIKRLEKIPIDEKKLKQEKEQQSRELLKEYLNEHQNDPRKVTNLNP